MPQDVISVGSAPSADLRVSSAGAAGEHARVERRAGRVYALALLGSDEDLQSETGGRAAGQLFLAAPGTSGAGSRPGCGARPGERGRQARLWTAPSCARARRT